MAILKSSVTDDRHHNIGAFVLICVIEVGRECVKKQCIVSKNAVHCEVDKV
jgi:hypothetical protein